MAKEVWNEVVKKPKLKRDWEGRKVRSKREFNTRFQQIARGTIFTVERNHGGLDLRSEACACCGLAARVRKVEEQDVELLPVGYVEDRKHGH
jgi:hypothetical protein